MGMNENLYWDLRWRMDVLTDEFKNIMDELQDVKKKLDEIKDKLNKGEKDEEQKGK